MDLNYSTGSSTQLYLHLEAIPIETMGYNLLRGREQIVNLLIGKLLKNRNRRTADGILQLDTYAI